MVSSLFQFRLARHHCCDPLYKVDQFCNAVIHSVTFIASRRVVKRQNKHPTLLRLWTAAGIFIKSFAETLSVPALCVVEKYCLPKGETRQVITVSPSPKPLYGFPLAPSRKSFFCFINLKGSSSYRILGIAAVTTNKVFNPHLLWMIIPHYKFSCSTSAHKSLFNAPFIILSGSRIRTIMIISSCIENGLVHPCLPISCSTISC